MPASGAAKSLGRPRKVVTAVELRAIEALAAIQCSDAEIAAGLTWTAATFYNLKRRDSAIEDALERGRARGRVIAPRAPMETG